MALGRPGRRRQPMGVLPILAGLIAAAFVGAVAGLIWQSQDWFDDAPEDEVVTAEAAEE